ncbi:MAG: hypothetical protein A2096_11195 [Spirochaetes bacterium GWF1_41_5]|nr:MAG: hypothetical protein A2096_11195 [Spirochaetes bacterium GWF1_41_5]
MQEIDENALFGTAETITVYTNQKTNVLIEAIKEAVSFSGSVRTKAGYGMDRHWAEGKKSRSDLTNNELDLSIEGNLLFDIRLAKGIKSFANLGVWYYPLGRNDQHLFTTLTVQGTNLVTNTLQYFETNIMYISFREFFIDANIARAVYLRLGKQVLKWGKGYFWNPSDLVNTDRKDFLDQSDYLNGNYGLKVHVPVKTVFNFYAWSGADNVRNLDELSIAGKAEWVMGRTEVSVSAWAKKHFLPVYGFDFSTRILGADVWGELGISYGANDYRMRSEQQYYIKTNFVETNAIVIAGTNAVIVSGFVIETNSSVKTNYSLFHIRNRWIPRASIGLTKTFRVGGIKDRLSFTGELFYNDGGYRHNVFKDQATRDYIISRGQYSPGRLSQWYAAGFMYFSKLGVQDLDSSLNYIINLTDKSSMASWSLLYKPVFNFDLTMTLAAFTGHLNTEYTTGGNLLSAEIIARLLF